MGIYNIMFYGGLILALVFLAASVAIFFLMKIPKAFGIVTGKTARKEIEEIRSGGQVATTKSKRKPVGSSIIARNIDATTGSDTLTRSDKLGKGKGKSSMLLRRGRDTAKQSSETGRMRAAEAMGAAASSEDIARRAAEDAKRETDRAEMAAKEKALKELEEEITDVLTYNDMMKKDAPDSEDETAILESEQDTDVLSYDEDGNPVEHVVGDDEETAVLANVKEPDPSIKSKVVEDEYDAEVTDVLKVTSARVDTDELEEEEDAADKTDVLIEDDNMSEGLTDSEIYGTYNPELTAVLRSEMAPGEDSLQKRGRVSLEGITVIYSETIVHTDESL